MSRIHSELPPGAREAMTPVDRLADVLRRADLPHGPVGTVTSSLVAFYAGRRFQTLLPNQPKGDGPEMWQDLDSGDLVDPTTLTPTTPEGE